MSTPTSPSRVSDAAVRAATGFGWEQWITRLDAAGAADWSHPRIVRWLRADAGLESAWWQQTVAVEFEKSRGLRAPVGETAEGTFQVGLQRTLDGPADAVWRGLLSRPARDAWLGPVDAFELREGAAYATEEGARGEVRRVVPGQRLRLTWQPHAWPRPARLQLTLTDKGPRITIGFHAERLPDAASREALRERWQEALSRLPGLG